MPNSISSDDGDESYTDLADARRTAPVYATPMDKMEARARKPPPIVPLVDDFAAWEQDTRSGIHPLLRIALPLLDRALRRAESSHKELTGLIGENFDAQPGPHPDSSAAEIRRATEAAFNEHERALKAVSVALRMWRWSSAAPAVGRHAAGELSRRLEVVDLQLRGAREHFEMQKSGRFDRLKSGIAKVRDTLRRRSGGRPDHVRTTSGDAPRRTLTSFDSQVSFATPDPSERRTGPASPAASFSSIDTTAHPFDDGLSRRASTSSESSAGDITFAPVEIPTRQRPSAVEMRFSPPEHVPKQFLEGLSSGPTVNPHHREPQPPTDMVDPLENDLDALLRRGEQMLLKLSSDGETRGPGGPDQDGSEATSPQKRLDASGRAAEAIRHAAYAQRQQTVGGPEATLGTARSDIRQVPHKKM